MEKLKTEYSPVINGDSEPCVIHVARNGTDLGNIKLTEARSWLLSGTV
jgi:hypothetical protein